jgi:hypothetical protein
VRLIVKGVLFPSVLHRYGAKRPAIFGKERFEVVALCSTSTGIAWASEADPQTLPSPNRCDGLRLVIVHSTHSSSYEEIGCMSIEIKWSKKKKWNGAKSWGMEIRIMYATQRVVTFLIICSMGRKVL